MKNNTKYLIAVIFVVIILVGLVIFFTQSKNHITVKEFVENPDKYIGKTITIRDKFISNFGGAFGSIYSEEAGHIVLDFGNWSDTSYYENNTELINKYYTLVNDQVFDFTGIIYEEDVINRYDENGTLVWIDYIFTVHDVNPIS